MLNQTRAVIKIFILILGETDHILHIYFAINLQVLSCPKEYVQHLEPRECQMLYNLACYLITEQHFSPHCPKKNISGNSETTFFCLISSSYIAQIRMRGTSTQSISKIHLWFPQQSSWLQLHFYRKRTEGKEDAPGKKVTESTWMGCTLTFLSCSFSDLSVLLAFSSLFIIDFMRILVAQGKSREKTASEIVLPWHALNQDMLCLELQLFSC